MRIISKVFELYHICICHKIVSYDKSVLNFSLLKANYILDYITF